MSRMRALASTRIFRATATRATFELCHGPSARIEGFHLRAMPDGGHRGLIETEPHFAAAAPDMAGRRAPGRCRR